MQVDIHKFLKEYKIDPRGSVHTAIATISDRIQNSSDALDAANVISFKLGASPAANLVDARLIALSLVEVAFRCSVDGTVYDVEEALTTARAKAERIGREMPWLYSVLKKNIVINDDGTETIVEPRAKRGNSDKKQLAAKLYEANKSKPIGEIVTTLQKEMAITYANAYYYVTRVFKHPKG
jgi:hypothetical protein